LLLLYITQKYVVLGGKIYIMIYILAGHCYDKKSPNYDSGAVSHDKKTTEANLTRDLRDRVSSILTNRSVKYTTDNDSDSLQQVLNAIKSDDSDVIIDIHFNAASPTATGVEVFVPDNPTKHELNTAVSLSSSLSVIMGIKNRGVKTESQSNRKRLAVMREKGIALLIEVCFISNPSDTVKYWARIDDVAKTIADHAQNADYLIDSV